MEWAFVWMMVGLKIPVVALLWIVWWSVRQVDAEHEQPADGGGGSDRSPHRRGPRRPRPPRRGPHAEPQPPAPQRVRARGRQLATRLR